MLLHTGKGAWGLGGVGDWVGLGEGGGEFNVKISEFSLIRKKMEFFLIQKIWKFYCAYLRNPKEDLFDLPYLFECNFPVLSFS